jgi:hypothetical protein
MHVVWAVVASEPVMAKPRVDAFRTGTGRGQRGRLGRVPTVCEVL